jgi:phosphatidylinositol alpha-1,6-mannosyltransferase
MLSAEPAHGPAGSGGPAGPGGAAGSGPVSSGSPGSDIVVSFDFLPKIGGAHLWLYEVYRRWSAQVRVLTTRCSPDPDEAQRQREFDRLDHGALQISREAQPVDDINLLDVRCLYAFSSQVRAIGRLSGERTTRLHALRAFPEGFAAYLYRKLHPRASRLITYAHGEEVLIAQTSLQLKLIATRVYAASDLVIANSENTRRIVLALCPSARVICIHPGVDTTAFVCAEEVVGAYRSQWNWPPETVVVCTLGRMEPRKNHAAVIRAVSELRKRGLAAALVCGGDGPEKDKLVSLAAALGLGPWVRFTGQVTDRDKRLTYLAADLYAMPSIQVGEMIEGFGIVFLEAAAAGLACVCGNNGGQGEAVLHGRTGLIVDGTRDQDVAAAIERLVRDAALRKEMGRAGKAWAAQNDWQQVVQSTVTEIGKVR